tara:strand:- start:63 stop:719 length:657 start_codon:yes stop_codon:yes gene_type:complete
MNLSGHNINQGFLSLTGSNVNYSVLGVGGAGNKDITKLNELKSYLNETFIQPLLIRDLEFINNNKYNFTYLNNQLLKYKHLSEKEVNLYLEIVRFAQECVVIMAKNEELEEKLHKNDGFMSIVTHVPSIILKPEFEIYKTFFGMPPRGKFDINAIKVIKNIIERNLGVNYDIIETLLLEIYHDPVRQSKGGFTWAVPLRRVKSAESNIPFLGDNYTLD